METVMVSPKFQVVIPRAIRESLRIWPGQHIQVIQYQNRIELIPLQPIKEMRGFLIGIDTTVEREADRLATACAHHATLWTQDADFENITSVRYTKKR